MRDGVDLAASAKDNNKFTFEVKESYKGAQITCEVTAKKASAGIFGGVTWGKDSESLGLADRIAGDNRYETAMAVADEMKPKDGFKTIVVASGEGYADALSGVILARDNKAPILLVNKATEQTVYDYIVENVAGYNTDIYILGGEKAVSADFETMLAKFDAERIGGADRYEINLKVLKKVDIAKNKGQFLVASGKGYADAISASATNRAIMLVGDELTDAQVAYLKECDKEFDKVTIVGGTVAVSEKVENRLRSKDVVKDIEKSVIRIAGTDRYDTNAKLIEEFKKGPFKDTKTAYVVSGEAWADALTCGAYTATDKGAIVLVSESKTEDVAKLIAGKKAWKEIVVIGGTASVSAETVQEIAPKAVA